MGKAIISDNGYFFLNAESPFRTRLPPKSVEYSVDEVMKITNLA